MQANSTGGKAISMGWHPESGFIERNWDGYNEGMALYLLALGSRSHPAKDGAYEAWTAPFPKYWRGEGANRYLAIACLYPRCDSELLRLFKTAVLACSRSRSRKTLRR
jgi:hypothetical protein